MSSSSLRPFAATVVALAVLAAMPAARAAEAAQVSAVRATAAAADIQFTQDTAGITPFVRYAQFVGTSLANVTAVSYTISPKPGALAKPVKVQYTIGALQRRGYAPAGGPLTLPVFGLYAGKNNAVTVAFDLSDGTRTSMDLTLRAKAYVDPFGIYDKPTIVTPRDPSVALGFSYLYMKSGEESPVIIDTDAQMRWVGPAVDSSFSSTFVDGAFIIGGHKDPSVTRMELDGVETSSMLDLPNVEWFNHDVNPGRDGLLAGVDMMLGGVEAIQSNIVEMTTTGHTLHHWDFAQIISDYMLANGDDPTQFVHPGLNWLHLNSALYDPSDDSLIVSSREQFVMKIDYDTSAIKWIFGDPTKYWHTFPSLRAKGITLTTAGGLYPIGQHRITIRADGSLMLFNNGMPSNGMPAGQAGEGRSYSAINAYVINPAKMTAKQVYSYLHDKSIKSNVCGSAYESSNKTKVFDYPAGEKGTHTHIVAVDGTDKMAFEYQYANTACGTAWNTIPINFDGLVIQ